MPDRAEDDRKLSVILLLQLVETKRQFLVGFDDLSKPDEGPDNANVDLDGLLGSENSGKHRNTVFSEGKNRL